MDYNDYDYDLIGFWVLTSAAALVSITVGSLVHMRGGSRAPGLYLVLGVAASIVYGIFAGIVVGAIFEPPYVPGLSEGRGLDLRGIGLIIGSWVGGALGVLATVLMWTISTFIRWRRKRRTTEPVVGPDRQVLPD
ncbi:hypothetical protein Q2T94_02210 [Paeniglutamicibacter sulfureus]|uniref:hypothetical protein n=1 Tax=Paeniglutamicibacter sulfureus TaxID=43666 RepID=UPI002665D4DE|nr:hypothetical protein [Paeniglutamicibacter sulfureus]MDO2933119.1 hypothetical protein [Paeniglutamicibacter sulfureus]